MSFSLLDGLMVQLSLERIVEIWKGKGTIEINTESHDEHIILSQ